MSRIRLNLRISLGQVGQVIAHDVGKVRSPAFISLDAAHGDALERLIQDPKSYAGPPRRLHAQRSGRTALVVATEWESRHGGISTFNRGLCAALADAGLDVECLVGPNERQRVVEPQELGLGTGAGSIHITPLAIDPSTLDTQVALTGTLQSMGAKVLDHVDIVIGHGHITGAAARALGETRYPRASRVHIIHTDPQGVAAFKATPDSAGVVNRGLEKARLERDNCASAHVVCGVGPKLKKIAQYL